MRVCGVWLGVAAALLATFALPAVAQDATSHGVLEFRFTPVGRAQLAIWVEREGQFVATVRLTEGVGLRGIGNRPGASEMNSGFRWPYGRREGVLPIWAARRASQPGALLFPRVIFQNRTSEGRASRTSDDSTVDHYYCLQWDKNKSRKDALDAVSCATVFSSDKGRFMTEDDVAKGYSEPYLVPGQQITSTRPLSLMSLYPPRRDVTACTSCLDHPDAARLADAARTVMPDIDSVTMATPVGEMQQDILFAIPPEWRDGSYRACVEVNVEGDYNDVFNQTTLPTPQNPDAGTVYWDDYALTWGYPYRGQPSVVYCTDVEVGGDVERTASSDQALGTTGVWDLEDPQFGSVRPMGDMTTDPINAPGSGGDRLRQDANGHRIQVIYKPQTACGEDTPPSAVTQLSASRYHDELHAHEWAHVEFDAASDDFGVFRYEVRVSTAPITDEASFMAGTPAKQATLEAAELMVPTTADPGERVDFDIGGLNAQTHYYIGVRALDACALHGAFSVAELTTPKRKFATVSPCFVATAAWGSPLAGEIGALRRLRDRELENNALGRALVRAYYEVGPALADAIRPHALVRAVVRAVLEPVVAIARMMDGDR